MAVERSARLNLYHCASLETAKGIKRCGFSSSDSAIPLFTSVAHAQRTAAVCGAVVECIVDVGRMHLGNPGEDKLPLNVEGLKSLGFDSAYIPGSEPGHDQYYLFDATRAKVLCVVQQFKKRFRMYNARNPQPQHIFCV